MQFIGIASQAELDEMQTFIERTGTSDFPQVADLSGDLWKAFGTGGRSTFLFINDDGTSALTTYGAVRQAELTERVESLIAS